MAKKKFKLNAKFWKKVIAWIMLIAMVLSILTIAISVLAS